MTLKFQWNGPQITAELRLAADRGVFRAAHIWRNEYLRLVMKTQKSGRTYRRGGVVHVASAPGQPPASDRGRLVASVRVDHQPGSLKAVVGVGTKYARALEFGTRHMAPRPAFLPAYTNKRSDMRQAIATELTKAGG